VGELKELVLAALRPVLANNYAFAVLLATCLYLRAALRVKTAQATGAAVVVIIGLASLFALALDTWLLSPWGLHYMHSAVLALSTVAATQLTLWGLRRSRPAEYRVLGDATFLFAAVFTLLVLASRSGLDGYGFARTMLNNLGTGIAFAVVLCLYAGIRERLELSPVPQQLRGLPVALLTIGLMAAALRGIEGIVK